MERDKGNVRKEETDAKGWDKCSKRERKREMRVEQTMPDNTMSFSGLTRHVPLLV